ncbi:hypothetical protein C8Q72DRAFT_883244 [Fomitopsis betulina]|nr:hypothetical protein C8Q72DRAFT_883244 [Fomitopsis betulina]
MLPAAPADELFSHYAASNTTQTERMTIKVPPKEMLVHARPKVGLRANRAAFTPTSERAAATTFATPAEFVVPLSAPVPPQVSVAPVSPPRLYGRPRRSPTSARHGRRAVPSCPSGTSGTPRFPSIRAETFESITCTPQLMSTSFEELRVECYRASYLATGHMPMPVTSESEAWDTIPPFYSPFVLEIPEASSFGSGLTDIMMCDQSDPDNQFAFGFQSTLAFSDRDSLVSDVGETSMDY